MASAHFYLDSYFFTNYMDVNCMHKMVAIQAAQEFAASFLSIR